MSFTSQKPRVHENAEPWPGGEEAATEAEELSGNVLAIIGGYRMGTALDAQVSLTAGASASPQLAERSAV